MNIAAETLDLHLRHTFTISRSSRSLVPVVLVTLSHQGVQGVGEASPSTRYGETPESVLSFLRNLRFPQEPEVGTILDAVSRDAEGNRSAQAAIDIALHDWSGRMLGTPVWQLLGLPAPVVRPTSLTIGIDKPEIMRQKVGEASAFRVLKVKVGTENDLLLVEAVRRVTDTPLRVDANEGWKSKELALEKIRALEGMGIEFIEQPMPAACLRDMAWLRERVNIPFIADESLRTVEDFPQLREAFDGINIKLMKCGGLRPARALIDAARGASMKVMLGCMIETSVGISAAAQLLGAADYVDLDGNLLITNDPYDGAAAIDGLLHPPTGPGIGVRPRSIA